MNKSDLSKHCFRVSRRIDQLNIDRWSSSNKYDNKGELIKKECKRYKDYKEIMKRL